MKGKYANAAERRRHLAELEERATTAERARQQAEAQLAAYRQKTGAELNRMTEKLRDAVNERDAQAAPRITELEKQVEAMRQRAVKAEGEQVELRDKWRRAVVSIAEYLMSAHKYTQVEAHEVIVSCMRGIQTTIALNTDQIDDSLGHDQAIARELTLGSVRGNRRPGALPTSPTAQIIAVRTP